MGWPDVLRVLQDDETRSQALGHYRAAGFTPDDFGRSRLARESMAQALTAVEDWLETAHPRRLAEREALRRVRRRVEVWG